MSTDDSLKQKIQRVLRLERVLRLVWQSGSGWTIASVTLLIVQGILPLLALYLMKLVVDAVTTGLASANVGIVFRQIAQLIGYAGGVALVEVLCRVAARLVSEAQSQVVTDYMCDIVHAKSIEVDLEYYENSQYYDALLRAQEEAPVRPPQIVNGLIEIARSGISLLAMSGLLLSFYWGLVALLFIATIPGILVQIKYTDQMYRWKRQRTLAERKAEYFDWLLTNGSSAKEIRIFDLGFLFKARFLDLRQQLRREILQIATRRSVTELVAQVSSTLVIFGSYALITYRTLQGIITLGDLIMYFQAFQRGQNFLREILDGLAGLYENNLFLSNLYEFLDLKPKVIEPLQPKTVPRPMQSGIVFEHVRFDYPTGTRKVLEDINLTIRPGEVVAFVGENGAGKTTLIKLLCRLYDVADGSITLDGIDIRHFEIAALRRQISIIFQDYAHYHLTARENIWLGNINLPPNAERIVTAAHRSGAAEVIYGLPHGFETILGNWFEDGEELSIGEWQKVALARAFVRDGQIIVLDEPSSALDARAEFEIFNKLHQLAEGRTVILISHRFSTVKMADCIYVVEGGRIVESGAHDELVHYGGTYARLFEMHAQHYWANPKCEINH